MVGGTVAESFLDNEAVDEDGAKYEDQEENGDNEYDVNDEFVDDREVVVDEGFYNRVNHKRVHYNEDQQACSSRKNTRLEEVIESYEEEMSELEDTDLDGQIKRKCVPSGRGRNDLLVEEFPVIEEEGVELVHFVQKRKNVPTNRCEKKNAKILVKKEYTNFLKDYSKYDVFKPLVEPDEDAEIRDKNQFQKMNLTHCILKSIVGCMFRKHRSDKEKFPEFVERLKKGIDENLHYQYDVLCRFSETPIKGCYFNEIQNYIRCIEAAMKKTMYINVFLEQKIVQSCSIYSDKKKFIRSNMKKLKEHKIRRPMKLIYPTVVPLPETKTVENSFNILIRKPSKINPLLLHCVTITNLNRMFKVVSQNNKVSTQNSLYICAGCTTSYISRDSYNSHVKNCTVNIRNKVKLLEKTYLRYDYRCARRKGFKLPFHIVFDVETKSFSHAETREEELVEVESGKKK